MIAQTKKIIKRKRGVNKRFAFVFLILGVGLVIAFLVFSSVNIRRQRQQLNSQLEIADREVVELKKKNELLKEGISGLDNPTKIEEAARDRLIMKKPGEEVVVVIPPEEKPAPEPEKKLNWWQKIIKMIGL